MLAEHIKLLAERQTKLLAERTKLLAEHNKLLAERQTKLLTEHNKLLAENTNCWLKDKPSCCLDDASGYWLNTPSRLVYHNKLLVE